MRKNPDKIFDYKHISRCEVSYKIISKLLNNRLRTILPIIISPPQSEFILNGDIHNNILIAHEILTTSLKERTKGVYMPIKLYMRKVYDKLEWDFIMKYFTDLGCDKWTN